mmetsp:Transcript_44442/g.142492  ORF Transcript_44442/g.142492 Transcript_44442/m.142492 type:complete len:574 (-) Transcript_44442:69-1790(-)
MPLTVDVTMGTDTYKALSIPDGCNSVGKWKDLVEQGHFGERVDCASRLVCRLERGGKPLGDIAQLPAPPASFVVDGPPFLVGAVAVMLQRATGEAPPAGVGMTPRTARGTSMSTPKVGHQATLLPTPPLTARESDARKSSVGRQAKSRLTSTRSTRGGPAAGKAGPDEPAGVLDGEAAEKVLHFWFEELSTEDWFRQSHALDDRIRRDFGALHQRAAAGELAGWMQRPDTCLALVVILDQFSRKIYGQGTPEGCAWDAMARVAANRALERRDDRERWEPGPKRSALYLPFMHSEDLADKRRCVALMREGLAPDKDRQPADIAAAVNAGTMTPAGTGGLSATNSLKATPRGGPASALPRLTGASGLRHRPTGPGAAAAAAAAAASGKRSSSNNGVAGAGAHGSQFIVAGAASHASDEEGGNDDDSDSDSDLGDLGPMIGVGASSAAQRRSLNAIGLVGNGALSARSPHSTHVGTPGGHQHHHRASALGPSVGGLGEEAAGSYNIQVALELPQLQVLSLNHEHARRFRAMKLDTQTQQAYMRDRKDVNRTVRYQCLVCAVNHEFKLSKGSAVGAE